MKKKYKPVTLVLLFVASIAVPVSSAWAGDGVFETGVYSPIIAGTCWPCDASGCHTYPTDGVKFRDKWNSYMKSYGYTTRESHDGTDVYDYGLNYSYDTQSGYYGVDRLDVVFFSGHGNTQVGDPNGQNGAMLMVGNPTTSLFGDCRSWTERDWWFGEDLNAFIAHSCNSLEYNTWYNWGMDSARQTAEFNIYNGWHGPMNWGSTMLSKFDSFMKNSRDANLGHNWVTMMTNLPGGAGGNNDSCATSMVWAANTTEADNVYYNSGLKTQKSSGWNDSWYYYIPRCDPAADGESNSPPLPN